MRFALRISSLISGRQMHRMNACIFLVAITKKNRYKAPLQRSFQQFYHKSANS